MHAPLMRPCAALALGSLLLIAPHATGAGGEVVWSLTFTAPDGSGAPRTGPDGNLYWVARDTLFKASPGGQIIWRRAGASSFGFGAAPVRIYAGGITESASPQNAVRALTLDNQIVWEYTDLAGIQGFIGGPDVGPDGNVYATADLGDTTGPGTFSLTPAGGFRWNIPGFGNRAGTPPSHLVFTSQLVFKGENTIPPPPNLLGSGLIGMRLDNGGPGWTRSYDVPGSAFTGPGRQPRANPVSGDVNTARWFTNDVIAYHADGSVAWTHPATQYGYSMTELDVGPDGSIFVGNGDRDVISLTAGGQERWIASQVVPGGAQGAFATPPVVSPDGQTVVFATSACNGGACAGSVVALNAANGSVRWGVSLPAQPAGLPSVAFAPTFSPDSSLVYISADAVGSSGATTYLFALCVSGGCAPPCYANCDHSGTAPVLNVLDFTCFLQRYGAGDAYANCDGSTSAPVLNVQDFTCFLQRFAQGCP